MCLLIGDPFVPDSQSFFKSMTFQFCAMRPFIPQLDVIHFFFSVDLVFKEELNLILEISDF